MDWFWLIAGVGSWFLGGYLSTNLLNAGILGHDSVHGSGKCDCQTEREKRFYWNRPVLTESGRFFFGVGVALGFITCLMLLFGLLIRFGTLLAPGRQDHIINWDLLERSDVRPPPPGYRPSRKTPPP